VADPRVTQLKAIPLFSQCSQRELEFIASQVEELDFPTGYVFCKQGETGHDFFVIVKGEAEVVRDGKRINTLRAGDFFGEIALVDEAPRTATVTATTPTKCLVLSHSQFQNVLHQRSDIALSVMKAMARRLRAIGMPPAD
jgi:CRP-like cAMP-binding protein